ncbi:MAG: efflux transporter outer membrane subunit [Myxococcota bacterium]|nr:efflux transporter outer membrane subunit [Myxococcota bacterium]
MGGNRAWLVPLLLLSCSTSSKNVALPAALPDRFSNTGSAELPQKWWLAFDDPGLHQLIDKALSDNLSLRGAWARLDQAAARAKKAGSSLWPSLDAEASAGYAFSDSGNNANFMLGLAAGYELDLWGRVRSVRDAAELDLMASSANLQAMAISLSAEVGAAWYQIAEKHLQLALLKQQDVTNRQILDLVTVRFRSGQAYAADVLQQRQLIESNAGEQARIAFQIEALEHRLAILLGLPPNRTAGDQATDLVALPHLPNTGVPADLVQRRPDVQSAYYAVQAADKRTAAAIAERFPRLSLLARASTSGPEVRDLFSNWLVNLAANLVAPILDGGRRKADVEISKAITGEAIHSYGQVVLEALAEVEDALTKEHRQRQRLESMEKQLFLSTQVNESIRDNYTKGAEVFLRVLDSLLKHQALQRSYITAKAELIVNRIDLYRALAGHWEMVRPHDKPSRAVNQTTSGGSR